MIIGAPSQAAQVSCAQAPAAVTALSGNSFTWTEGPITCTETVNGVLVTCTIAAAGSGTVSGNTITGNFQTTQFTCNGILFSLVGTFTVTKVAVASVGVSSAQGLVNIAVSRGLELRGR